MKQLDRPLPPDGTGRYDEARFRTALRTLGLFPPVDLEDVHRAYKARARRLHPDRHEPGEGRDRATRKIQEINAARDYVVRHFRGFDLMQNARYRRSSGPTRQREPGRGWSEWLLLPVTGLFAVATLVVAAPFVGLSTLAGSARLRAWRARVGRAGRVAWRIWIALAPYAALLALFLAPAPDAVRAWAGLTVLVMASADVATLVTGDENELRRHRPVTRARSLAEELA